MAFTWFWVESCSESSEDLLFNLNIGLPTKREMYT